MDAVLQAEEPKSETEKSGKTGTKKTASKDDDKEADDPKGVENPFPKRFKLDGGELSGGVEWLNCGGEISTKLATNSVCGFTRRAARFARSPCAMTCNSR